MGGGRKNKENEENNGNNGKQRKAKGKNREEENTSDAIVFSCNRANESESGCEDVVNCAGTVKVSCAPPSDKEHAHAVQL